MVSKFWTLTGIAVIALVFGAGPAIAQTKDERDHAGGQADDFTTEGQQGAKDNTGKTAKTTGERDHAGGQADDFTTEGQQGAKDNTGKANKQEKSKNKNNGKAGSPSDNGGGTDETRGTGGATPK